MDRDPGEFSARTPPAVVADMSDAEFDAWMESIPPAPGIRHIDDPDAGSEDRAFADFQAGRFHDHAVVSRWLRTWGSAEQKPFRDWLAEQNG